MNLFTLLSGKALRSAQILIASLIFLISSCKKMDHESVARMKHLHKIGQSPP